MNKLIIAIIALMVPTGCQTTKYIPVYRNNTDSVYSKEIRTDTFIRTDSTVFDNASDTVRITRYRTEIRRQTIRDTLWHTRTDTIKVTIQEPAPRQSLWNISSNVATGLLIGAIAAWLLTRRLR